MTIIIIIINPMVITIFFILISFSNIDDSQATNFVRYSQIDNIIVAAKCQ